MINEIAQFSGSGISILLLTAIVIALVLAFKIMEMVFETLIVTISSGIFYIILRYMQGGPISLNDLLLFSFLGATLYMIYTLLESAYSIGATLIPLPYKIAKTVSWPFRWTWNKYEEREKRKSYVNRDKEEKEETKSEDKTTKEVVLGSSDDED
jgi:hypothetical protein